ncbi:hypothetical protein MMYC01_202828 [Madurella mycetomatis]|uniref:Uncharacterized protein n=1 Tax=Madurella mycetomatis TaxID=100816 RepID=A0A175W875_9PEZI|nr:hypothetical protein MMYC01_202828 [Madurella mycetomatis]
MATPPVPISPNQGDAATRGRRRAWEESTIYRLIMTPLIFTSFLVSLVLVDLRHSVLRAHYHADANQHGRMPGWLHRVVYRYLPYRYDGDSPSSPSQSSSSSSSGAATKAEGDGRGGHYHSKQRELMKMEAAEAFEIRGIVVTKVVAGDDGDGASGT